MGDTNPLTGVSGPSKFAVREDLPPSQNYGDRKVMQEDIAGASTRPNPDVNPAVKPEPIVELFAPSGNKAQDVMAGVDMGPDVGSNALGMTKVTVKLSDTLAKMLPYDTTGEIAVLYQQALARGD